MIRATVGILASQAGVLPPLLDTYTGAAAAYSLRLLRSAYTGDAIEVRIDTTGQPTYDIGFVNGELDVTTLEGYCTGGLNAYVTTWYDQSGNGYDATQGTDANQPQIVSSGSVILENGKPAVKFDGTDDYLTKDFNTTFSQPNTYFTLLKRNNNISQNYVDSFTPTSNRAALFYNNGNNIYAGSTLESSNNDSYILMTALFNTSSSRIFINTIHFVTGNSGNDNAQPIIIGAYKPGSVHANMQMQELILYPSDQSSNRSGIETNINDFYDIY